MEELALGLIETVGFIPAVEAADAAAKAAEVKIAGVQKVGQGLVTVVIVGDLSPVQAAVECGCDAAALLGKVHSTTVIARQGEGLSLLMPQEKKQEKQKKAASPAKPLKTEPKEQSTTLVKPENPVKPKQSAGNYDLSQLTSTRLQRKKVADLRAILHAIQDGLWPKAEIDSANKRKLIMMIKRVVNNQ